jgi:hypothetical protein
MQSFSLRWSIIHIVLAAFLAFSLTFFLITTLFFNNASKFIIIISKIPWLSIDTRYHSKVHSIGCSGLQHWCLLQYHTMNSVLTSRCSFISQYIWITIWIRLGILGRCINIEIYSWGNSWMWICLSGCQIDDLGLLFSGDVTHSDGSRAGQRWHRLWSRLSAPVTWCCTRFFASPGCQSIVCGAIWQGRQPDVWL